MLEIGLVGGACYYHGRVFPQMFNGYDKTAARKRKWPLYSSRVGKNAKITYIWDEDAKAAREVARICGIDHIVDRKEDMIGKVDGVIITDDGTMKHQKRSLPFLRAGIPTFIDKPLSPSPLEAQRIVNLARRHRAPIMSCSALRYAKEIKDVMKKRREIGEILTGTAICAGDLVFYGIHPCEGLYVLLGERVKSVRNVGDKGKDILAVRYKDGRRFLVIANEDINYLLQINLYGTKGSAQINIEDSEHFYSEMLKNFVGMVKTGKEPFSVSETLEIIRILALGKKSRVHHRELELGGRLARAKG